MTWIELSKKFLIPAKIVGGKRCQPGTPARRTRVWTDRREQDEAKWKDVIELKFSKEDQVQISPRGREKMVCVNKIYNYLSYLTR